MNARDLGWQERHLLPGEPGCAQLLSLDLTRI